MNSRYLFFCIASDLLPHTEPSGFHTSFWPSFLLRILLTVNKEFLLMHYIYFKLHVYGRMNFCWRPHAAVRLQVVHPCFNYYRTLSNVLNSHAERCICFPPLPTLYGLNLVVASASWDWRRPTATANKVCSDSIRSEQVKNECLSYWLWWQFC